MIQISTRSNEPALHVLPGADLASRRAVCQDCGAHAAVVTTGVSMTGACSVCGSSKLRLLDARVPPPRRLAR